ncbi:MAG: sugar ABC transporter permease [Mesorhizobium sp.]|nr:MAG: sugar ABC transporter permease [Mesorhizobium sp.]
MNRNAPRADARVRPGEQKTMTASIESLPIASDRAQRAGERYTGMVLLAPTMIIMTVVGLFPLLHSLYMSITGYRPADPDKFQGFVGLGNYADAVTDAQFLHSILLTLLFTVLSVGLSLTFAILLALLFNLRLRGFTVLRTIIIVPMLITPIAVGITWRIMMMPDLGVLNYVLSLAGIPPQPWAGEKASAMASMVLVDVWQWTPFMFLIIFAGLSALPKSPFEAAAIDGASPVQTFFMVTLPMLKPVIVIASLLRIVDAIRTYDTVYIITRGGPDFATDLLSVYLARVNFRFFNLGYGAALSWITLLIILTVVLIFVKYTGFMRMVNEKEAR